MVTHLFTFPLSRKCNVFVFSGFCANCAFDARITQRNTLLCRNKCLSDFRNLKKKCTETGVNCVNYEPLRFKKLTSNVCLMQHNWTLVAPDTLQSRVQPEFFALKEIQNFKVLIKCYFGGVISVKLSKLSAFADLGMLKKSRKWQSCSKSWSNLLKYLHKKFFRATSVSALFPNAWSVNFSISRKKYIFKDVPLILSHIDKTAEAWAVVCSIAYIVASRKDFSQ